MSEAKHLQAAGYSIASKIVVQILTRALTFILGAITLKYLQSSALLGIINVRLALLYTTLQFLSREPFRRACLGQAAKSKSKTWNKIVNTIWLGFLLSLLLATSLAYIWKLNTPSTEDLAGTNTKDYQNAVIIVCIAVIVEMLAEPCYIYAQAKAISDHGPWVEGVCVTSKCVMVTVVTVLESTKYTSGQSSHILTKISICQLLASTISVIYSFKTLCGRQKLSPREFLPGPLKTKDASEENDRLIYNYLDRPSLKLSFGFLLQTFLKQLLTEGERYVMTFFNVITLSEQGVYDVVNNLGSLTARLIFQPIEDSGFTLFSQTVSRTEILDIRKFYRVQENLMLLVKSVLLIGISVLTLAYNFVPLIVLYGGEKLNNPIAFTLMRWQLFYTPLLAVNGVTECFTFAIMTTSEISQYNTCMVLFSMIYLVSLYLTQPYLGSASFILANCIIMISRIIFSIRIIRTYFKKHGYELKLQNSLPSLVTLISLGGVFVFLFISQQYLLDLTQPTYIMFGLILGAWSLLFMIRVVMFHEEDLLRFASKLFKIKFH